MLSNLAFRLYSTAILLAVMVLALPTRGALSETHEPNETSSSSSPTTKKDFAEAFAHSLVVEARWKLNLLDKEYTRIRRGIKPLPPPLHLDELNSRGVQILELVLEAYYCENLGMPATSEELFRALLGPSHLKHLPHNFHSLSNPSLPALELSISASWKNSGSLRFILLISSWSSKILLTISVIKKAMRYKNLMIVFYQVCTTSFGSRARITTELANHRMAMILPCLQPVPSIDTVGSPRLSKKTFESRYT